MFEEKSGILLLEEQLYCEEWSPAVYCHLANFCKISPANPKVVLIWGNASGNCTLQCNTHSSKKNAKSSVALYMFFPPWDCASHLPSLTKSSTFKTQFKSCVWPPLIKRADTSQSVHCHTFLFLTPQMYSWRQKLMFIIYFNASTR